MARGKTFGQTWWGNAWVDALENIDRDTNRLPRGRSYARGDKVSQIEVSLEGLVKAKVQGRRRSPYKVELKLKKFSAKEVLAIQMVIAQNPALACELSLGRLPQNLLAVLEKKDINLLPDSWSDIAAHCSCPDWANPCKHLAAVYYIMANEIDKDPFILFALRQINREALLEASGFAADDLKEKALDREKLFFVPWDQASPPIPKEPADKENIDVSTLAHDPQGKRIFALLKAKPYFQPRNDFKNKLLQAYERCSGSLAGLDLLEDGYSFQNVRFTLLYPPSVKLKKTTPLQQGVGQVLNDYNFFLSPEDGQELPLRLPFLGEEKTISLPRYDVKKPALKRVKGLVVPVGEVIDFFLTLPFALPPEASSAGADFLSAVVSTCQALGQAQAFIPEVNPLEENGSFALFYRPLPRAKTLQEVMGRLCLMQPPGFVYSQKGKSTLKSMDALAEAMKLILTHIMVRFCHKEASSGDLVEEAFFQGKYYYADSFEKKHTGRAIENWLAWLNVTSASAVPLIKIGLPRKEGQKYPLVVEVKNPHDALAPVVPLARVFAEDEEIERIFSRPAPVVRQEVALQLTIGGEYLPVLKDILQHRGQMGARVSPGSMAEFLSKTREVFGLLGIGVIIPKKLKNLAMPRAALTASSKGSATVSYLNLADLLDFSWQVALGDQVLDPEEFRRLAAKAGQVIKYQEEYVLLDPLEVQKILTRLDSPQPKMSSMEILRAAISGEVAGNPFVADKLLTEMVTSLNSRSEDGLVPLPAGLEADLRPYQHRGLSWLFENTLRGLGSCLADDMGLGKTLQVIALILKLQEEAWLKEPALVVCPTTLIGNWQKEIARFAPTLKVGVYHGSNRQLPLKNTDIIITSYGLLRGDKAKFKRRKWGLVIIDEAQNIKNPDTEQTRAVKGLSSKVSIALTGTPVENRLTELWSIYDFINPGYLGDKKSFIGNFAIPIEKYRDRRKIESLRKATAPFMLRRLKSDGSVIKDLPEKIIQNDYCYLTKEQAALYQEVTESLLKQVEESEGIERRGLVFKLITALKQVCNHPAQYAKGGGRQKKYSGKAAKTMDLLQAFTVGNEKALIFTQYKEMGFILLDLIREELEQEPLFFHGSLSRLQRDKMVADFQRCDGPSIMIVSLRAGGTGLNLTAAAKVIHYDLWWNPAVEDQATDRTYRIGQLKNVTVHRLISIGTFEEKINAMIEGKRELAQLTVAAGEARISEMSNKELRELIRLTEADHE